MNGLTWRDIEFAAQLGGLPPLVMAIIQAHDDRVNQRIDGLYSLFGTAATAATEAESRCMDFEDRLARIEVSLAALPPVLP